MPSTDPAAYCLERAGRRRPGWDTLVVTGTADTTLSPGDLRAVWSDLELRDRPGPAVDQQQRRGIRPPGVACQPGGGGYGMRVVGVRCG